MTRFLKTINKLESLKLSEYPVDEIKKSLSEFGIVGFVALTLHKGKTIVRARPNDLDETFKTISELSYKPSRFNDNYQRASTPFMTMFYGCVVPENIENCEIESARVTAVLEASKLYRRGIKSGEEKITFSLWTVIKDIPLIAIVYNQDFVKTSPQANELYLAYQSFLKQNNAYDILKNNSITEFLAFEFGKSETPNDFDYIISALFCELVVQKGFAGVYYPSVRAEGKGFNVAIHPDFVDSCMNPIVAVECFLYKSGNQSLLDNKSLAVIGQRQTEIKFVPIIDPTRHGKLEFYYKILDCSREI